MKGRAFRTGVACVLAAAAGCFGVPTAAEFPDDGPPSTFEVVYGGFGFGSHDVTLRGDTLVVVRRVDFRPDSTTTSRVIPTRDAWGAFWRAADAAGVRSWPRECLNRDVVDGGGFSLRITWPGGRVEASGGNSYPQHGGCNRSPEWSPEYKAFNAAVAQLIGMRYP